jgi:hypothetical protein
LASTRLSIGDVPDDWKLPAPLPFRGRNASISAAQSETPNTTTGEHLA